jgi:indole-3-glycerol phosphate synthase
MPTLGDILDTTRATLPALRDQTAELERAAGSRPAAPDFAAALAGSATVALIAEVKRRSPSAGAINEGLDPVTLARAYAAGGAAAISVLTDAPFFGGSLADLAAVADQVNRPVIRKDFILDEVQLLEARAAGAAAALLIVRALDQLALVRLSRFGGALGLAVLVEVHNAVELDRALEADAAIIGVNARDLDTFTINCRAAWDLLHRIPADRIAVAESGMVTVTDVADAAAAGADAILVGSALAASGDPEGGAQALAGVHRRWR